MASKGTANLGPHRAFHHGVLLVKLQSAIRVVQDSQDSKLSSEEAIKVNISDYLVHLHLHIYVRASRSPVSLYP